MKKLLPLLFFVLLHANLFADDSKDFAIKLLDKAVENLMADAGVQMEFSYSVCDGNGDVQFTDEGVFLMDSSADENKLQRYSLKMNEMQVWCDGELQWTYMTQSNEVYVTKANSNEMQNLSPLYFMQLYKNGYTCSAEARSGNMEVTLRPQQETVDFDEVLIILDMKTLRPKRIYLYTNVSDCAKISINGYKRECKFENSQFVCPAELLKSAEVINMYD